MAQKTGYYRCYFETLLELNFTLSYEEMDQRIQRKWGQPFREELRELLKEKPQLLDQACEIFSSKFWGDTFISALKEVKGANNVLTNLSRKYQLAVATGNHPKMLEEKIIPKFKVPRIFSQIITSFDIPSDKTKPNPYMLEQIMKKQGYLPTECIYIGDAENDVLMAKNAKVEPVVVLTGHLDRDRAAKLDIKYILLDITCLPEILN